MHEERPGHASSGVDANLSIPFLIATVLRLLFVVFCCVCVCVCLCVCVCSAPGHSFFTYFFLFLAPWGLRKDRKGQMSQF